MTILELREKLIQLFPDYNWMIPQDLKHGIFTSNIAFQKAKEARTNPAILASELVLHINGELSSSDLPLQATNIGPYINLLPSDTLIQQSARQVDFESHIPRFPTTNTKAMVEYFAPNVAKLFHVGHIRPANIGESLRRIHSLAYHTISDRHLGDWGVQFGLVIWGILNTDVYDLPKVDLHDTNPKEVVQQLYNLYVAVHALTDTNDTIKKEVQAVVKQLEVEFGDENSQIITLWRKIVEVSLEGVNKTSEYLALNKNGFWNARQLQTPNWSQEVQSLLEGKLGVWEHNNFHREYRPDVDFAESFLVHFKDEAYKWVEAGLCISDEPVTAGSNVYLDLETESLGRCYLISSDGYTTYIFRDVVVRFLWTGLFGTTINLTLSDYRQKHSFDQTFAVIQRILDSGYYEKTPFPMLSQEQSLLAVNTLKKRMAEFVSFGTFVLPEGSMSTRKGRIFSLQTLLDALEQKVTLTLQEKGYSDITPEKIRILSIAALKWADLHRDRDQNVVFNLDTVTTFEGNTGIYQLYTVSRLKNILKKSGVSESDLSKAHIDSNILTEAEMQFLSAIYTFDAIVESIFQNHKPHLICNHLFELASQINSWYANTPVLKEEDQVRKTTLLALVTKLVHHLTIALNLLGIEVVEEM